MKRVSTLFSILAASVLMSAVPVFAADEEMGAVAQKDECLLIAKNCAGTVDSIQQKIAKLNAEIAKGTKVYTTEELARLKDKLTETSVMLDRLLSN